MLGGLLVQHNSYITWQERWLPGVWARRFHGLLAASVFVPSLTALVIFLSSLQNSITVCTRLFLLGRFVLYSWILYVNLRDCSCVVVCVVGGGAGLLLCDVMRMWVWIVGGVREECWWLLWWRLFSLHNVNSKFIQNFYFLFFCIFNLFNLK